MKVLYSFLCAFIASGTCLEFRSVCKVRFKIFQDKVPTPLHTPIYTLGSQNRSFCVQKLVSKNVWKSLSFSKKGGCKFYNQTFKDVELVDKNGNQYINTDECEIRNSCAGWLHAGNKQSGTYCISVGSSKYNVSCDMETEGGGWMIFQRRIDGALSFERNWQEYAEGFGDPASEHWIGNHLLHGLTSKHPYELRVNLIDCVGNEAYAKYGEFSVASEGDKFKLHIAKYSGTAGDSLINVGSTMVVNGMAFTTKDRDNDKYSGNCAKYRNAGWWYNACKYGHPNGLFVSTDGADTIRWNSWKYQVALCGTTLMMRPVGTE